MLFVELLPESIREDAQLAAAAETLDGMLRKTTLTIPNLLIWARLDRESSLALPPLARLIEASGGLKPLSSELLELLAWQMHVDFREVAVDDAMLERMVRESIPWHRIKGTPAAVVQALAMYGIEARTDESGTGVNWAVYELELAAAPRGRTLSDIVRVAEEAAPKRCWLRRVHGEFDRRPIITDAGPRLDDGYLDDDSGVWDPETGVKQSFGETLRGLAKGDSRAVLMCAGQTHSGRGYYIDKPILDRWRLDDPTTRNYGIVSSVVVSLMSAGIQGGQYPWSGPWDRRVWNELADYPGAGPMPVRRIDRRRALSKSQLVLDSGRLDASVERMDRQIAYVLDTPQRLDVSALDAAREDLGIRAVVIDERFIATRALATPEENRTSQGGFAVLAVLDLGVGRAETDMPGVNVITYHEELLGLLAVRRPYADPWGGEWHGPWAERNWRTQAVPMRVTTLEEGE
jgi:hypothetical protein